MKYPTPKQAVTLRAIVRIQKRTGASPSLKQLCRATGRSSLSTVFKHLKALEEKGWIRRPFGARCAIEIVQHKRTTQCPVCGKKAA